MRGLAGRVLIRLALVATLGAGSGSASVLFMYSGVDNGAGPGGLFPNSSAAESAFWLSIGAIAPTVTFESVGSLAALGSGISAVLTNADPMSGLQLTDQHSPEALGFNITSGGNEWLKLAPSFNSATGATVTFNFTTAIRAFGVWFTDTQSNFPGPITITFNDGTAETLTVPKNGLDSLGASSGGAVYFGFVTDNYFSSLSINTGATTDSRDVWGIDNISVSTGAVPNPEPSTLSLFACAALLGCFGFKLRGKALWCAVPLIRHAVQSRRR